MVTLALDVDDLLAQAPGAPSESVAPGTSIGHVHLKVADVPRATTFYRDVLGLEEQALLPSAAFLSAGGYHHHIGLNSWQSGGASASPPSTPGLREIDFELSSEASIDALCRGVAEAHANAPEQNGEETGAVKLEDPDGIELSFTPAPAHRQAAAQA